MSKRYGFLIQKIVERPNMDRAFDEVVRQLREPRRTYYHHRKEEIVERLTERILTGSFRVTHYRQMLVTDGPKVRLVQSPCVEDRIGCNAIMRVVEDVLYPSVIKTSAASIPGRGMHSLFVKMRHDIERDRKGTVYYYKCDIKKFFESINQNLMWECMQRMIKDKILLPILQNFITMMDKGLSIGLRSSQCFGNVFLSGIDHYFKDELGVKYYYRYCDDIVILAENKLKLWLLRDIMHEQAARIKLEVKANECVRPISDGIDFLGYVYDGKKARLRKRIKKKAAKRLSKVKSRKRRQEIIGSFKGMAKWCESRYLFKKLVRSNMESFSELSKKKRSAGVDYVGKDGKRILHGRLECLRNLVNTHVTILDFEPDVQTKNGLRHVVQFRMDDGTTCKYLTNDSEQKFWLEIMKKDNNLPFDCTIRAQHFGQGKVRYMFN